MMRDWQREAGLAAGTGELSSQVISSNVASLHACARSLSGSSPAHLSEKVHNLLAAARAALVATGALVCVLELPVLLQLAAALLRLAHALWVRRTLWLRAMRLCRGQLLASLAIIRMTSVGSVRCLAGMRLLGVGELVVSDRRLFRVGELGLLRRCGRRTRCT